MQKEHEELVKSLLSRVETEAREKIPTEEQLSQADAIWLLINTEDYLRSVLLHSQTGKSTLEVFLVKGPILDIPGNVSESLVLQVQTRVDDKNRRGYLASVKGTMVVEQVFQNGDPVVGKRPADEDEAKEWFEKHFGEFGWGADSASKNGSTWTGFLLRYFHSGESLAKNHGQLLGEILNKLQILVK